MTSLSRRTTFPPGWAGEPLERRIALSRALLAVERILPRLWPAFGFGGFYIALALTGLFQIIPWPAQALLLAATVTAIGLSLEDGFRDFQWLIPVTIGALFMADRFIEGFTFGHYMWPIIIIGIGLSMMLRPKRKHDCI